MKGVLVAAGLGEQLARRARRGSRQLCPPVEHPPIDGAIEAFARAGFEEVAVIVGDNEDVLWDYLEDSARYGLAVFCLQNAQSARGTATAIYAARAFVGGEPFVVAQSGCSVTANMLLTLRDRGWGAHAICVERRTGRHKESHGARKVCLDEKGCVRRVGQHLRHWHALCTGAFLFQPDVFGYISDLLLHVDEDCSISALLQHMIAYGAAPYACDVSPEWEGVLGGEHLLVWTAPMLSVRLAPERLAA